MARRPGLAWKVGNYLATLLIRMVHGSMRRTTKCKVDDDNYGIASM